VVQVTKESCVLSRSSLSWPPGPALKSSQRTCCAERSHTTIVALAPPTSEESCPLSESVRRSLSRPLCPSSQSRPDDQLLPLKTVPQSVYSLGQQRVTWRSWHCPHHQWQRRPTLCGAVTHTRTHTHAPARPHTHTRTHARTHARARTHTHTHARAPARTHPHTHTPTHPPTHPPTHTHTHTHTVTHSIVEQPARPGYGQSF
jgi:hypothetical protein